ncbi:non-functional pseudokinase ZED1-like [Camellia sinensis]|uniref:non-functional pseudokinase ZED1-like n=1 Tax=Camellia sinensis TaxID=4442 RepID=UPI001035757A|nr:non-functional pseudokinase ZED1-like [Camellia sinensis]
MECGGGILSSFFNTRCRREESERHESFLENGSKVLEEFITSWNGRWSIPIRNFSAQELIRSTNNYDPRHLVDEDAYYALYVGSFGERPILVKKYRSLGLDNFSGGAHLKAGAVRDIVTTSQMSCHKNVLMLIGCCLESEYPFLVYEDVGSTELLSHSFKSEDFSISIVIPPGESQVKDMVISSRSLVEPQYLQTGILTEKTDVYDFGMFLVELLTGKRIADIQLHLQYGCFEDYVHKGGLNEIVDARTREGSGGGVEQEQQLQAFVSLAMQCLQKEGEDMPEMIDVAKELKRIQRPPLVHPPSAQTINPL